MIYHEKDKNRLISFYDKLIEEYGPYNPKALGWNDEASKNVRLDVLCGVGKINGHSVLDVGCGFGDLYDFLTQHYNDFVYTGIDVNPKMIEAAHSKYPTANFDVIDFGEYVGEKSDYVLSSGALSFKISDYKQFYFEHIRKMFESSRIAVAFNMLNKKYHVDDDTFASYTIPEVYKFCSGLTDKIVIRQDYLLQDFTFYLYH